MNIFEWADQFHWLADYYEMETGYTYLVSQCEPGADKIPVVDSSGVCVGYARRSMMKED